MLKSFLPFAALFVMIAGCKSNTDATESNAGSTTEATSNLKTDSTTDLAGNTLYMAFDTSKSTVVVTFNGQKIEMAQQPSGSGIRYAGNGYTYEEWQQEIRLLKDSTVLFENATAANNRSKTEETALEDKDMPENFIGPNGERMNVGYETTGEKPVAYVVYFDDPVQKLVQTEAWAKGAIYKNDKMTWEVSGNKGTLTVDGKKVSMKKTN